MHACIHALSCLFRDDYMTIFPYIWPSLYIPPINPTSFSEWVHCDCEDIKKHGEERLPGFMPYVPLCCDLPEDGSASGPLPSFTESLSLVFFIISLLKVQVAVQNMEPGHHQGVEGANSYTSLLKINCFTFSSFWGVVGILISMRQIWHNFCSNWWY